MFVIGNVPAFQCVGFLLVIFIVLINQGSFLLSGSLPLFKSLFFIKLHLRKCPRGRCHCQDWTDFYTWLVYLWELEDILHLVILLWESFSDDLVLVWMLCKHVWEPLGICEPYTMCVKILFVFISAIKRADQCYSILCVSLSAHVLHMCIPYVHPRVLVLCHCSPYPSKCQSRCSDLSLLLPALVLIPKCYWQSLQLLNCSYNPWCPDWLLYYCLNWNVVYPSPGLLSVGYCWKFSCTNHR